MAERTADVQAHWTRPGALARIDAALAELGHDPRNLSPEILSTLEHLHSGGLLDARTALLAKPMNGINAPQRPDCVAGHVRFEVRRETGKE